MGKTAVGAAEKREPLIIDQFVDVLKHIIEDYDTDQDNLGRSIGEAEVLLDKFEAKYGKDSNRSSN